jgi:ribonucleoside-diphosphate reductase alpha chain
VRASLASSALSGRPCCVIGKLAYRWPHAAAPKAVAAAEVKRPAAVAEKPDPFATPRSGHLHPLPGNGHGSNGNGHGKNGNGGGSAPAAGRLALAADEKIRLARLKGYEGDPCPECGQLTLVRSGACAKCDTCGATSGCS